MKFKPRKVQENTKKDSSRKIKEQQQKTKAIKKINERQHLIYRGKKGRAVSHQETKGIERIRRKTHIW